MYATISQSVLITDYGKSSDLPRGPSWLAYDYCTMATNEEEPPHLDQKPLEINYIGTVINHAKSAKFVNFGKNLVRLDYSGVKKETDDIASKATSGRVMCTNSLTIRRLTTSVSSVSYNVDRAGFGWAYPQLTSYDARYLAGGRRLLY